MLTLLGYVYRVDFHLQSVSADLYTKFMVTKIFHRDKKSGAV